MTLFAFLTITLCLPLILFPVFDLACFCALLFGFICHFSSFQYFLTLPHFSGFRLLSQINPLMNSIPSASNRSLQDTSPTINPTYYQAALLRQGEIIRAYQNQVDALQQQATASPPAPAPHRYRINLRDLQTIVEDSFASVITFSSINLKCMRQREPGVLSCYHF